ncbi:MAG: response regulator transcription factor [Dehalococcoidia bacterium]
MTVRVLIADDQELIRSGFRAILGHAPDIEVVAEAATGAEAVRLARGSAADVVLMDIRMPGTDGIEATRALCRGSRDGRPHVLIVTTYPDDEYVFESLRAGASGFLLKDATAEQLIEAVHVVARGDGLLSPQVTREVIEQFARRAGPPHPTAPAPTASGETLTDRESEVLALLARGLSNAEIAAALTVSEPTVKTHVAHILAKLDLRNRVQAVVYAYEYGLAPAREV